ncbi:glycerol kinase, partial [Pseudoalteromonas agarivorans]
ATVERRTVTESTSLGVSFLAGLHTGIYVSTEQLAKMWTCDRRFKPTMSADESNYLYAKWQHCVEQVRLSS